MSLKISNSWDIYPCGYNLPYEVFEVFKCAGTRDIQMVGRVRSCLAYVNDGHIGNFVISEKKCFEAARMIKDHKLKSQMHLGLKLLFLWPW